MTETTAPPPSTATIYGWQADQFGVGIAQNYALVIVEEVSEAVEVLHDREVGLSMRDVRQGLRTELGDVMITLHSFAGFEGFELTLPTSQVSGGVWEVRDALVRDAGKLARAVLKRAQGIRDREQTWSAQARWAAGRLMRSAASLAMMFELDPATVLRERWAEVSTRDATGHRPAADERAAGNADDQCPACDAGIADGHVCGRTFVDRGTPEHPNVSPEPDRLDAIEGQGEPVLVAPGQTVQLAHPQSPVVVQVIWHGPSAVLSMGPGGVVYGRPAPGATEDFEVKAWGFEAERDAARASLAGIAEALGMERPARADARGEVAAQIERQARLIYRQHQAQEADEGRWTAELSTVQGQLSDLRIAVQNATGCEPGEELAAVGGRDVGLAQYVCDALARESDDHDDVRGIVSRAGRKIAELHGRVDTMRDQLCRAVGLPLISDDGVDARWERALNRARGLQITLGTTTIPTADVDAAGTQARPWRVGDRVTTSIPAEPVAPSNVVNWAGTVAQLGPAGPAHGILPVLPEGWVRVALDPVPNLTMTPPHAVARGWIDRSPDQAARLMTRMEDGRG
jgi:hypothetical protein